MYRCYLFLLSNNPFNLTAATGCWDPCNITEFLFAVTPPSSPLKKDFSETPVSTVTSQQLSAELEKSLAVKTTNGEENGVKIPKRFSGVIPSVEELAEIKQKKKVLCRILLLLNFNILMNCKSNLIAEVLTLY